MDRDRLTELAARLLRSTAFEVATGIAAGVAIIILAVAVSALVFGSYGWGLFVLTPLVVGFTTGYLVNRRGLRPSGETTGFVLLAAAIGCVGLILFALEGLICLILASPLAAALAVAGGALGRRAAKGRHDPATPFYSVALLPLMFALDAAAPPDALILTDERVVIDAPADRVWQAVTGDEPIRERPTLAGRVGLAYPERAHLAGRRVGAARTGYFSTGEAHETVTEWRENRRLGFVVNSQPPTMTEMSPYRHVHAPHVDGYFQTGETRFELEPLARGRTRLTVTAAHRLRIDPVLYWEPIARWAAAGNTRRVLRDLKAKAERAP